MRFHPAAIALACAFALSDAQAAMPSDAPMRLSQAQQPAAPAQPLLPAVPALPEPDAPDVDPDGPPVTAAPAPRLDPVGPHAPQCSWVGRRVQLLLARDDVIAAREFLSIYRAFDCPVTHLARSFGCLVAEVLPEEAQAVEERAQHCWRNVGN